MKTIFVKDFSEFPGPRFRRLGPDSGEQFREEVLIPAIEKAGVESIKVNLDGTFGYGSSFLDEAFGGLARRKVLGHDQVDTLVSNLISEEDPSLIEEIRSYLLDELADGE